MQLLIHMIQIMLQAGAYFISILCFVPDLKGWRKRIGLFALLSVDIGVFQAVTGNIGVIFLLLTVGCYLYLTAGRNSRTICMYAVSYLYNVLFDSLASLVIVAFQMESLTGQRSVPVLLIYLTALLAVTGGIYAILNRLNFFARSARFPNEFWHSVTGNLLICVVLFVANIVAGEYAGYTPQIIRANSLVFWTYFAVTTLLSVGYIRRFLRRAEDEQLKNELAAMKEYTDQIEEMYLSVRKFRHDYVNIMTSMSGYLENGDLNGAKNYFYEDVLPAGKELAGQDFRITELIQVKIPEVKTILSSKLTLAHVENIKVEIEVREPVEKVGMDSLDLVRILGIFLDNAIEAAKRAKDSWIGFVMMPEDGALTILVANSFEPPSVQSSVISQEKHTDVLRREHGIGLQTVTEILDRYPNVTWEQMREGNIYTQKMEIR